MDADTLQSFKRSSDSISSLYMWCWFWALYCFSPPENLFKAKSLWEVILCAWQVQPENRITGSCSLLWALFQHILHHQCEPSLTDCSWTTNFLMSFCEMNPECSAPRRTKLCIIFVSNYLKFQVFPASCSRVRHQSGTMWHSQLKER